MTATTPDTFTPRTDGELTAMYLGQWLGELHIRDDHHALRERARTTVHNLSLQEAAKGGIDADDAAALEAARAFLAHFDELEADEENERQWESERTDTITANNINAGHTLACPACQQRIDAFTFVRDATVAFAMTRHVDTPIYPVWKPETPGITYLDESEAYAHPCNCTLTTEHAELVAAALEQRRAFRMRPE